MRQGYHDMKSDLYPVCILLLLLSSMLLMVWSPANFEHKRSLKSLGKAKVPEKNLKGAAKGLLSYYPKQSKGRDSGVVQSYEVIIAKRRL
jgi:hypothetical protein